MMAEYIEREAHCKRCIHHDICDSYSGFDVVTFFPHNEDCEYFKPTADAVEARHGEWVDKPSGRYLHMASWCSVCGKKSGIGGIESNRHKPYCPNCGAKMDGKEHGV